MHVRIATEKTLFSLIWDCAVCLDLYCSQLYSVRNFRTFIIFVIKRTLSSQHVMMLYKKHEKGGDCVFCVFFL